MTTQVKGIQQLKGTIFAAQACSCSCDPCTCEDPCDCQAAGAYLGPRWRFIGDSIESGTLDGVDLSQRILLNLALTTSENSHDWQEFILIDDGATSQQVDVLLKHFQEQQGSDLAHPDYARSGRAVYLVPMRHTMVDRREILCVTCMSDRIRQVRGDSHPGQSKLKEWTYNGHIAVLRRLEQ